MTGFSVATGQGTRPTIASGVASDAVYMVRVWTEDGSDDAVVDHETGAFLVACDSLAQVQLSAVDVAGVELRGTA